MKCLKIVSLLSLVTASLGNDDVLRTPAETCQEQSECLSIEFDLSGCENCQPGEKCITAKLEDIFVKENILPGVDLKLYPGEYKNGLLCRLG